MSSLFISYTGRDPEGDRWADRLAGWFEEWNYGFFRDKDHSHGIKAGADWRASLYQQLGLAQALISLCTRQYESSPWCVGEVAIAVEKGKTVIPIQLADTPEALKEQPLPLLLQDRQAIRVIPASAPTPEQLAEVKHRLRQTLEEKLNWRALQSWDGSQPPYPGLPAFRAEQAPVFFGRDGAIERVCERLACLALRPKAFLLLLGASGYGKSSLVRAGVVPRLQADRDQRWLVLEPFKPGLDPFAALRGVLRAPPGQSATTAGEPAPAPAGERSAADSADEAAARLTRQLHSLASEARAPVVLVIDQFEELLSDASRSGRDQGEGGRFLAFLEELLLLPAAGVIVLATLRTDFLDLLQVRWPDLLGLATTEPLKPIRPEDFGQLITGPAARSGLRLQPGLTERLVAESGGRDALPLLAFTLEKLWRKRQQRGGPARGPDGELWDLTVADYDTLGGVAGAVSHQAALCWNPATSSADDTAALRQAFLDHLLSLNDDGLAAKRPARLAELPPRSQPILRRLVDDRLLVSDAGVVEIAHEALLRTWEPLVGWIAEGREELLQGLRVRRLLASLTPEAPAKTRRNTLTDLAEMAAAGGSEARAVKKEAAARLAALLADGAVPEADRQDGALVLALVGAEAPLREALADAGAPVAVRRRAAESLGLLAKRSDDRQQCERIAAELEQWLRSEPLDVRIDVEVDPAVLAEVTNAVDDYVRQLATAGQLEGLSEELIARSRQDLIEQTLRRQPCDSARSPGWAEHDARLPLLQGAAWGLQLAASADLPLFGTGPGRVVPMLTLEAQEQGMALRIRTAVVEPQVWKLPLPNGEQLELVAVAGGEYAIGSPPGEAGRAVYSEQRVRQKCEGVDVEAMRRVRLASYGMVRHPISQGQWRAVVEAAAPERRGQLQASPDTFRPEGARERFGLPGALPVDSVSWNMCQLWLQALNDWLARQWPHWVEQHPGLCSEAVQLALPSESQWEVACRAGSVTPFHFGATLDPCWARYDATYTYGKGRRGDYAKRPVLIGSFGLVNRWGLAEMHGQLREWCADRWHRDPVSGAPGDGRALEEPDPGLVEVPMEQEMRLLRGGSWISVPVYARAAMRLSGPPDNLYTFVGVRPGCFSPPGLLLYT